MAVWRLQVNTGGTNVADYCLKNHVAAMGWSLRELTQAERSGIHTFLDYCNLARTQYKSFDSVCRMVEDVKERGGSGYVVGKTSRVMEILYGKGYESGE